MQQKIRVLYSLKAYRKMRQWVEMAKGEVSGLGLVSEESTPTGQLLQYIVTDIFLIKQQCSGTDTLLDSGAIGQFMIELVQQNIDVSKIKLWWHSHGDLKTFWSATDEQCVRDLTNSSFMISTVTNKEESLLTRIDLYRPFHVTVNNIETDIQYPDDPELDQFCAQEFQSKVTEHTFSPQAFAAGIDPSDREIDRLEDLVGAGKLSLEEYEERMSRMIPLDR